MNEEYREMLFFVIITVIGCVIAAILTFCLIKAILIPVVTFLIRLITFPLYFY